MQEITYINLLGEAAVFGSGPPFVFASAKGTEAADLSRKTLKSAMRDGERTVSLLRDGRAVDVTFHVFARDRKDLYRERARLSNILGAEKGFDRATGARARIVYKNDYGTWWTWAVPSKPPQWPKRIQDIHASVKTSFECDSAYWFAMDEDHQDFVTFSKDFSLPFTFPARFGYRALTAVLVNYGHAPTPVKITVYGQGERPAIINRTTGARISFSSLLPQGTVLEMNTDPEDLYVMIVEDGEQRNAYGYLDVTTPISDFFLVPGENRVEYESGDATAKTPVFMTWRDRFEGV